MPKDGYTEIEYEDASILDVAAGRFAVADGAAESISARLWAETLVHSFLQEHAHSGFCAWFASAQRVWFDSIPWSGMKYYEENKAKKGSFATFAGLWLSDAKRNKWTAIVVGDCCVFHIRHNALLRAFPLTQASAFGNTPDLLRSLGTTPKEAVRKLKTIKGIWEPGDTILLATDAVAQWCLHSLEREHPPWVVLQNMQSTEEFRAVIIDQRSCGGIRNDDSTLLRIQF